MVLHRLLQKTQTQRCGYLLLSGSWVSVLPLITYLSSRGPKRKTGSCIVYKSYPLFLAAMNQCPANARPTGTRNESSVRSGLLFWCMDWFQMLGIVFWRLMSPAELQDRKQSSPVLSGTPSGADHQVWGDHSASWATARSPWWYSTR